VQDIVVQAQVDPGNVFFLHMPEDGYKRRMSIHLSLKNTPEYPGFVFPGYIGHYINENCEGYAKLKDWVSWRGATGRAWGLVATVFNDLNAQCKTPQEVRYFWPCLVALMGLCPDLAESADKIRPYRVPSSIAPLHPALRAACEHTSGIVTSGLLYPDERHHPPEFLKTQWVALTSTDYDRDRTPWNPNLFCLDLS
jgi:hypothetical protein